MATPEPRHVAGETIPSLGPLYQDIRDTMQISWVPDVFSALGEVPGYLTFAWKQLNPSVETAQFVRLAEQVQKDAVAAVRSLYVPSYDVGDVQQVGVPLEQQAEIRTALAALMFGHSQTLLAVKALRLAIEGSPPGGRKRISWPRSATTWAMQPIPDVDEATVGQRVRDVFTEAREALRLPRVPWSFRVIAPWPRYLQLAWGDLIGVAHEPEFAAAQSELVEQAPALCDLFPARVDVTPERLAMKGQSIFQIQRARAILRSYDRLLPTDLLLTACLRYPLGGDSVISTRS